jgi:hypothetical protein
MKQVAGTLLLARVATESIHGFDRVSLDAAYELDRRGRSVAIDAHSDVGHTLALVFLGYARREFGEDAVRVVPAARAETALANRPDKGLVQ